MTQFLPDNLLALFEARPPLPYKPPPDELLVDRKRPKMSGLSEYIHLFEDPKDTPPKPVYETKEERRARRRKEKEELLAYKIEQGIATWNPAQNPGATVDPYKTLFVARINYETSESKLRREFEQFGKISRLTLVHDKNGKPRGYAFIEYQHKESMSEAYKKADGMKIDGRRVVVDYERGRTQKSWLPRRLGGGKGDTRRLRESKAVLEAAALEVAHEDRDHRSSSTHRSYSHDRERERNGSVSSNSRRHSRSRDRDRERDRDRDRDSRRYDDHRSSRDGRSDGDRDREYRDRDRDRDRGREYDRRRH
uniref:U1 small nuclear ribonucleoprotein 70 kDa n=1 Tax=Onchocerca volvulus TaxID=6282 RepID=A0A8R1Y3Y0_ONCVO